MLRGTTERVGQCLQRELIKICFSIYCAVVPHTTYDNTHGHDASHGRTPPAVAVAVFQRLPT